MSEQEIDKIETGDVMDALIAALMESKPEAVSAKALREREQMTQWYSTHDAYSPGNWWRAEIGTDHNKDEAGIFRIERDNAPVVWRHARNPSEDIADAWEVIEKLAALIATPDVSPEVKKLANEEIENLLTSIVKPSLSKFTASSSGIVL